MVPPASHPLFPARAPAPALAALLALVVSACAAPRPEVTGEPLPFHVAVVPLLDADVQVFEATSEPSDEEDGEAERIPVVLSGEDVSRGVVDALDGTVFTAASLLAPPAEGEPDDSHWVAAAQGVGADLLLRCERVRYVPVAETGRVNFLSSSLPLFLLGGPFVYFIDDRDYTVDARISASLYDLNEIRQGRERGGGLLPLERSFAHEPFEARPDPIRLHFSQRVESGDLGAWGVSVLVPTGFLETDNELVRATVVEQSIASLGHNLAIQMHGRAREILRPDAARASFHLDPESFHAEVDPGGRLEVSAEVALRPSKNTTELGSARLRIGGEVVEGSFRRLGPQAGGLERYVVEASTSLASVGARPEHLQLEVRDRGTVSNTRSWTFPMPSEATPSAEAGGPQTTAGGREGAERP